MPSLAKAKGLLIGCLGQAAA